MNNASQSKLEKLLTKGKKRKLKRMPTVAAVDTIRTYAQNHSQQGFACGDYKEETLALHKCGMN
ncbi:hypothetical protein NIES4101_83570 [Calothrix sp. NIES-4101]|nr:hypothetical protein NIES4101_83570 [Calothrix sp. NIES-4101]